MRRVPLLYFSRGQLESPDLTRILSWMRLPRISKAKQERADNDCNEKQRSVQANA